MNTCQHKHCTVEVNEGILFLKKTLRCNLAPWLRPLALEPNPMGRYPSSATYQLCDLCKLLNVSMPQFLPL